jgi:uncharacterized membrane protein YfcA
LAVIGVAYVALLAMALLRGGHGMRSLVGIDTCAPASWVILVVAQAICFGMAYVGYRKHEERLTRSADPEASRQKLHVLLRNSYLAGIIAGLLGVGGGMVMNPVMLNLGFLPEVSTAVSAFCVFFTSSSTTTQFIIQGAVTVQDSVVFLVVSAVGSYIGGNLISKLVEKHKRPSYLIWLLFGLLVIAIAVMPTLGLYRIFQTGILGFEKPC